MKNIKCYAVLFVDEYVDYLQLACVTSVECIDLSSICTDIYNTKNIKAYIENVLKVYKFKLYWTEDDFKVFCEQHKNDVYVKIEYFNFNTALNKMLKGKTVVNIAKGKHRIYFYDDKVNCFYCSINESIYVIKSFYIDAILSTNWYEFDK